MYTDLQLHIDGEWLNGNGRKGEEVINPATGKALGNCRMPPRPISIARSPPPRRASPCGARRRAYDRAKVMRKAADLVRERAEHIARVMAQEQGKIVRRSRGRGAHHRRHLRLVRRGRPPRLWPHRPGPRQGHASDGAAGAGRRGCGFHAVEFPDADAGAQDRGALAAGCSIILKAAEETPGSCVELVRCFADAGLPKGVLNLVFGVPADVSEHLIGSEIVRKISFTGSVPVGKHLAGLAAKGMKRATMELGGHSPVMVFGDADPEKTADTIAAFKFRNAGQVCISPTRFYVQEPVYDRFRQALHRICQQHQARRRPREGHHHGSARQSAPARRDGSDRQRLPRRAAARSSPAASVTAIRAISSSRR